MGKNDIEIACSLLETGGIIAYPTESVWGLGCDPYNESAVQRILDLKQRPLDKGLILVAGEFDQIEDLIGPLSGEFGDRLRTSWPGPTTWLIPDPLNFFPNWIKGQHSSVAIRISAHPLVSALCNQFGQPVVSTSANFSGQLEIKSKADVECQFGINIDYILDGELGGRQNTSTIRDLITGKILR
jgi:L-threonylcarbamoyladenylate synthase